MKSVSMSRRAFTLLELIVVITIIAILMSVGLMVGHHVVNSGRTKATANVIQLLDQALSAYQNATNSKPPAMFTDDLGNEFPLADAYESGTLVPSTSYLLAVLKKEPAANAIIANIPSEFVTRVPATALGGATPTERLNNADSTIVLLNVIDSWGNPIRFVHPKFGGNYTAADNRTFVLKRASGSPQTITLRRDAIGATLDADGGQCPTGRPYFYSAGPDGDPTTRSDNIYSTMPTFAPEVTRLQRG